MAIVPAGTANLFASNLGIPKKIDGAVEVGLHGERRKLDVGSMNGEKFAVMAGVGFDALVIHAANSELKRVLGRTAYVWAAAKNLRAKPFEAQVEVDGKEWYEGPASLRPVRQRRRSVRRSEGVHGRSARRRPARDRRRRAPTAWSSGAARSRAVRSAT